MNYIKDAEETLYKHRDSKQIINNLKLRLSKLQIKSKPREINAIDYSKNISSTNKQDAINEFAEVNHLLKKINEVQEKTFVVDTILEQIKKEDKEAETFLQCRYINKMKMEDIANELGYSNNSKETMYKIKDKALALFIEFYWGEY